VSDVSNADSDDPLPTLLTVDKRWDYDSGASGAAVHGRRCTSCDWSLRSAGEELTCTATAWILSYRLRRCHETTTACGRGVQTRDKSKT